MYWHLNYFDWRHHFPPSLEMDPWVLVVPDTLSGFWECAGDAIFQISSCWNVSKVIKDTPILFTISWMGFFKDQLSGSRLCPRYLEFCGHKDVRKVIKDTPILHLRRCHVSNFRSLGWQEGNQRHPYPPSPELDPCRTGGSWPTFFI